MPSLTDGQIKNALKRVAKAQKPETLVDGEGRGTGRLILVIKPQPTRVTSVFYAQQWRDGKRKLKKLGEYPHMSLADAREVFTRDFSATINKGASIKVQGDTRPGTVGDLFEGYADWLRDSGKMSHKEARKGLNKIADELGRNRLARDIEPVDVLNVLRPIYERGKKAMADHVRSYVRSAYSWGMKSENDYRSTSPRRFNLVSNPAAGIPTEPKKPGERWLREDEWVKMWRWLQNPDSLTHESYPLAIMLLMLTGQRVQEICTLHKDQYDAEEGIIDWHKTKNGRPHAIPLPSLAKELLDSITPNEHGWYFPGQKDPSTSVQHQTLYSFLWRQRDRGVIPHVTNRDLRRTFKTLAGKAGLTQEIRDRLQNHARFDVSSRHYDRYSYMDEKREAMDIWDKFVRDMIRDKTPPRLTVIAGTEAA
ncbi:integrase [Klebsiella phage SopranoGao]|uniref:Integrase n=1 Tax=Klebsiella phage SopranoGao TaxID=2026944 RepID=A0A248SL35_9CAUD|nr:integrase [Klebsiella phage SopranoGao]ASV45100.1 integrase [Klebsiella phage SopranoGao]